MSKYNSKSERQEKRDQLGYRGEFLVVDAGFLLRTLSQQLCDPGSISTSLVCFFVRNDDTF